VYRVLKVFKVLLVVAVVVGQLKRQTTPQSTMIKLLQTLLAEHLQLRFQQHHQQAIILKLQMALGIGQ